MKLTYPSGNFVSTSILSFQKLLLIKINFSQSGHDLLFCAIEMMEYFVMQRLYHSRCLRTIDNEQSILNMQSSPTAFALSISKCEKCKFEEAFLVLKPSEVLSRFIDRNRICKMTKITGASDSFVFDGNGIFKKRN